MGGGGGVERCIQNFVRNPKGKNHLNCLSVGENIILKWILRKSVLNALIGLNWLTVNRPSGFIKRKKILD
jgi:hypothetical protein